MEELQSLDELLIRHPSDTFFVRVKGNSMIGAGIHDGSMLIVDRSIHPKDNKIIVAKVEGDFTVKRLRIRGKKMFLVAENPNYPAIEITPDTDFEIWGVVIHIIHTPC